MSHIEDQETDPEESIFEQSQSYSPPTRSEKYRRILDVWVLAPIRVIKTDPRAIIGSILVGIYVLMGTVGVVLVNPPKPNQGERYLGAFENSNFILGTDQLGQDIFAMVVHGTPPMLEMVLSGAVFAIAMGTVIGAVAGYKGGITDNVLMTITDTMMTIPGFPLIIVISAIIEPEHAATIGIILAINVWASLARQIRSQVIALRDEGYVEASRLMGAPLHHVMIRDIAPNIMPFVFVKFVNAAKYIIFSSVALYFLGFLPMSGKNWGVMMNKAYNAVSLYLLEGLNWLLAPMFAIIGLSLGLILLAQSLDRVFNPKIRAKHAETIEDS